MAAMVRLSETYDYKGGTQHSALRGKYSACVRVAAPQSGPLSRKDIAEKVRITVRCDAYSLPVLVNGATIPVHHLPAGTVA
jgi:hypothetical protein